MKAQEIYNRVVNHLRRQGRRAMRSNGACLYRTDSGMKCAAGVLIKDSEYHKFMENKTVGELLTERAVHNGTTPEDMFNRLGPFKNLIGELQMAHDESVPSKWEPKFKQIAENFNLKYTAPPKNNKR